VAASCGGGISREIAGGKFTAEVKPRGGAARLVKFRAHIDVFEGGIGNKVLALNPLE
jgi:hypothetical protein